MEDVMPGVEKIILDGKAGDRMLPYLPLDKSHKPPKAAAEEKKP